MCPCQKCPVLVRCKIKYDDEDAIGVTVDCPLVWDYVIEQTTPGIYSKRLLRFMEIKDIFPALHYLHDNKTGDNF